ncbi:MAG TPA: GNAT family N-acetyltransferase [Acidimicrobiia bacterium]
MTAVREATHDEIPELIDMLEGLHVASASAELAPYCRDTMTETLGNLIEHGFLMRTDHGVLGGLPFPLFFNRAALGIQELFWWVMPEYRKTGEGIALVQAFEDWGREIGAKFVIMMSQETMPAVNELYASRGYTRAEQNWTRTL